MGVPLARSHPEAQLRVIAESSVSNFPEFWRILDLLDLHIIMKF
jgi:hypothetical protein